MNNDQNTLDSELADSDSVNLGSNPSSPANGNIDVSALSQAKIASEQPEFSEQSAHIGRTEVGTVCLTVSRLIASYLTDPASPYHAKRYFSRLQTDSLCRILGAELGAQSVEDIRTRDILTLHKSWSDNRGVCMAHSLVGELRKLCSYGAAILEDDACAKLSARLHTQRFAMGKPRTKILSYEQVLAVMRTAHAMGYDSIALAQAGQFDLCLRQKDLLGEWVPVSEPGRNYLVAGDIKWFRGLRWETIDQNLILRHITSKRQKAITFDLKLAPLFMKELQDRFGLMSELPRRGPVVISELTGLPWQSHSFRRMWRIIARKAGIPDDVQNRDARAGAITEALASGSRLESVRKSATHSDSKMTQKYSRGDEEEIAEVMKLRAAARGAV